MSAPFGRGINCLIYIIGNYQNVTNAEQHKSLWNLRKVLVLSLHSLRLPVQMFS